MNEANVLFVGEERLTETVQACSFGALGFKLPGCFGTEGRMGRALPEGSVLVLLYKHFTLISVDFMN